MNTAKELQSITQSLEQITKRLRKVEILARSSSGLGGTFLDLNDTPDSYEGYAGWVPAVHIEQDRLFFTLISGACVTFICGSIGWRAVGGTDPRTLIHETAFQLDSDGDDRGLNAIDLQQNRQNDFEVASAENSIIFGGRRNMIDVDSYGSSIRGYENNIEDECDYTHIAGDFNRVYSNTVYGGGYNVTVLGSSNWVQDGVYCFVSGIWHDIHKPGYSGSGISCFGMTLFGEAAEIIPDYDYPTYCGVFGLDNWMVGDNYGCYIFGENCRGQASGQNSWNINVNNVIMGLHCYAEDVLYNAIFGQLCKSYNPQSSAGEFYNCRIVLNGDEPNSYVSDGTPKTGGANQTSWFSQADLITSWPTSWTTSRYQFPIIEDSTWGIIAEIEATEQDAANVFRWKIRGIIKNAGGTTTVVWSVVSNNYRDVLTKEWQIAADDANDRLIFQFRDTAGPDSTYCMTQLSMHSVEVGYA